MNLQVDVQGNGKKSVVKLSGEVDVYTASVLKEKLNPIAQEAEQLIIIDLSDVHYIDSTGLGIFIGALKTADKSNSSLKIIGANSRVKRLFEITGLNEVIDINEDQREEV
ncbi:STAS domain-containing protein [Evansella sp. AB-rgal1]|uniref:STAS domain-containing protein n=1 Tax=Evansella sp. AB-rgal1 TaxID=3242696 RepID=UPI00359DD3DB